MSEVARLAAMVEFSADAMIGKDLDGVVTEWNRAAEAMFGYSEQEAVGRTLLDLIVPLDLYTEEADTLARIARGDTAPQFETRRRRSDGTLFDAAVTVSPVRSADGQVVGAAIVVRDMTDEMADRADLRLHEARLAAIVENASDAIIGNTLDGVITDWNRAAESMFGYSAQDAIGRTVLELIVPAEHQNEECETLARIARGERVPPFQTQRRRQDGTLFDAGVTVSPIRTRDGIIVGAAKVLRDVSQETAHKKLAEAAANAKAAFLAAMSHELRTPLHSIIGFSTLLLESEELKCEAARRHAGLIHDSSKTLLSIVNDVLDVAKLDESRLDLDLHPFSPKSLVDSVIHLLGVQAASRGLPLRVELSDDLPDCLQGDEARLRQILLNLTSNALKFTAKGEVCVRAEKLDVSGGKVQIRFSVSDTGIGIPPSQRHRIFERFYQVDNSTSRRYGGTGLGLSICKDLVTLMGGEIGFDSQEGQGARFWFTVPLADAVLDPHGVVSEDWRAGPIASRSLEILLADDVEINQELVVLILNRMGHHVDVVSDGAAAIDAVQRKVYDIVLMDIQMPTMDGIEATARIRALNSAQLRLPIIALTAAVMTEDIARIRAVGMDDHLVKPFLPLQLKGIIDRWGFGSPAGAMNPAHDPIFTQEVDKMPAFSNENRADGAAKALSDVSGADRQSALDEAVFKLFVRHVGSDKAHTFARRFAEDLAVRFARPEDRAALRKDAHAIRASAGAIGFAALAAAAKIVEDLCRSDGDLAPGLVDLLDARARASECLAVRFA